MNAIYEMAQIIQRIEQTSKILLNAGGSNGTLVASQISSRSESLNAVPFECEIYLDRRLAQGESRETVEREMNAIVEGKNASWQVGVLHRTSWTGMDLSYHPFHPAWQIDRDHELTRICVDAFHRAFGTGPEFDYWDFSTNAVATIEAGIPTIGFGPGEYKLAHMVNENCRTRQIVEARLIYVCVMGRC